MLTFLFLIGMITIFSKFTVLALRGAWGLTKILLTLVFLPLILIGMLFSGLVVVALPVLLVVGVLALMDHA